MPRRKRVTKVRIELKTLLNRFALIHPITPTLVTGGLMWSVSMVLESVSISTSFFCRVPCVYPPSLWRAVHLAP